MKVCEICESSIESHISYKEDELTGFMEMGAEINSYLKSM
jgi:hypothetical protein